MKLIRKTQRIYLVFIVVLLVVLSGIFMIALSSALSKNINETLYSELRSFLYEYQSRDSIKTFSTQQITVRNIPQIRDTTVNYSDTTIFNSVEHEPFLYRQITTQALIGGKSYQVIFRRSMVEYDDLFEAILIVELIFALLLIAGLFFINRTLLNRLWNPFYTTLNQITHYQVGQWGQIEWSATKIDEFQQLYRVLEQMIAQIEQEYKSLKSFSENASHEIQTPISSMVNQIEVLLQDDSLSRKQWQILQEIDHAARKLSRLNKALLLLTKIENRQYPGTTAVSVSDITKRLCGEYLDLAAAHGIDMDIQVDEDIEISLNAGLAEIMIRNMLSNAVKHNHIGGTVTVFLEVGRLRISNSGEVPEEDPIHYLDRFKKGEPHSDSLGLGLSIIAAIAETNDMGLSYHYENELHTVQIDF